MTIQAEAGESAHNGSVQVDSPVDEKNLEVKHLEDVVTTDQNLVYDEEEEPELHARTFVAFGAMCLLNLVQIVALLGPPAVVSNL